MATYAHIINPYTTKRDSEDAQIHAITTKSIVEAKQKSGIDVKLYYTSYPSEEITIDPEFKSANPLTEHGIDLKQLNEQRKLPRLKDILNSLPNECNSDYIIFTNMDIGLMPNFYSYVDEQISKGFDALVINRRRVSIKFLTDHSINEIVSEVGKSHSGYDTFVFKRSLLPQFILGNTFIGIPHTSNDLFYNLFCLAQKPALLTDKHLTFHIGMELVKNWGDKKIAGYNYNEFIKTVKQLESKIDLEKFPGAHFPFFTRHFKWLFNPTIHYPGIAILDLKQLNRKKNTIINPDQKPRSYHEWIMRKVNLNEKG